MAIKRNWLAAGRNWGWEQYEKNPEPPRHVWNQCALDLRREVNTSGRLQPFQRQLLRRVRSF